MRSAFNCALDLQKELNEDGVEATGWNSHSSDAEISKEGLRIIQRHFERAIREAKSEAASPKPIEKQEALGL